MAIPGNTVCCTASVTKARRRKATWTPTTAPSVPSSKTSTSAREMTPSRYGSKINARNGYVVVTMVLSPASTTALRPYVSPSSSGVSASAMGAKATW